jgi:hypothetical protein
MYAALDPIYMVMLIKVLGPAYEIWDKAASIRFRRPGRNTLRATFRVEAGDLETIRGAVARDGKAEHRFAVDLLDEAGEPVASCEKILSIRQKATPPPAGA